MTILSSDIRTKYLEFFKTKQHAIIPSAPLVPENDPSVLFNTAGMQPLVPYLLGERHPLGKRIADVQKCVRTGDIDDVGDDTHLTFFEMLGNWSLGDYFKKESIPWSWEFLTSKEWLGLDPKMISVTVFEGDENAPRDEESAAIWKSIGMPADRIAYLPAEDNWWAAGPTGPCGPDTEIFYWMGEGFPPAGSNKGTDSKMWMEIWNNVFMQYNRVDAKTLVNLPAQCVDTGMGLERITTALNHEKSVYHTDVFKDVIAKIHDIVGTDAKENVDWDVTRKSTRIIADHLRAATHMIADGVFPKNVDQGYILRRLIRRAIREAYKMGYEQPITAEIARMYIEKFSAVYDSVKNNQDRIIDELVKEEEKFAKTLKDGIKEFKKLVEHIKVIQERDIVYNTKGVDMGVSDGVSIETRAIYLDVDFYKNHGNYKINKRQVFKLYDTYGFPLEMTKELANEQGLDIDEIGFQEEFKKHQDLSRTSSEGKFKWGLADQSDETVALHSACHLMLAGLRKVLGDHVAQAGSNITAERLRFDFTHSEKMTPEQLKAVEDYVNAAIESRATMVMTEVAKEEAKATGVTGSFWEKYSDIVKVYTMTGPDGTVWTRELCGGPHVAATEGMGHFHIVKEEASSAGVRRIKAVLEK